jgi:hypothetical protein
MFQELLQTWLELRPNPIRGYIWAVCYDTRRDAPKVNICILLHRRATEADAARITTAVEQAFEDITIVSIAVTMKTKAFLSIVTRRIPQS